MTALDVAAAFGEARAAGVDRLDAALLLAHGLGRSRSWLIAHDDAPLTTEQASEWRAVLARRADGEPLAYLIGEKEFHGLMLRVDRRVLVPRPETEGLVDWAIELLDGPLRHIASPRVIDLGTGSGAIAIAVKRARPHVSMTATDLSAGALELAQENARRAGTDIVWHSGSWWEALPAGDAAFDLVVSNPPYIAHDDAHLEALRHEPASALTPGGDGSAALRTIVSGAARHLAPGAWLLMEHGHDQGELARRLLTEAGWAEARTRPDLAGIDRCSGAHR